MRAAAEVLLASLDEQQHERAAFAFGSDAERRWLEYRPEARPGACLALLSPASRKAAHRLLATSLSEHAFAQAMAVVALEEVLDVREGGVLGRHSADYWVSVFGDPAGSEPWSWRFEGHHLSVTMTVVGDEVSPAPLFLGANPACVSYAGVSVSRPLAPEEELGRAVLDALSPAARAIAVVADRAPADIHSATSPQARRVLPAGIAATELDSSARTALDELLTLYLCRLPAELADAEMRRLDGQELHFAWEGPASPDQRHYYRVQSDDLLIEFDTTDDGNHAHSVLRRPRSDFGADILTAHYRTAHA